MQIDMQRKREKERVQKEIDKLRESIQMLTKAYVQFVLLSFDYIYCYSWSYLFDVWLQCNGSSVPLGRTLDFLQEDIDMMQKEMAKWSEEYEQNLKLLKRQQA